MHFDFFLVKFVVEANQRQGEENNSSFALEDNLEEATVQ